MSDLLCMFSFLCFEKREGFFFLENIHFFELLIFLNFFILSIFHFFQNNLFG